MALFDTLKSLISDFLVFARERSSEPLDGRPDEEAGAVSPKDESLLSASEREARAYREAQYLSPGGWC